MSSENIPKLSDDQLKALLQAGKVEDFNKYRRDNCHVELNLAGLDAKDLDLSGAFLRWADLTGVLNIELSKGLDTANLQDAKLSDDQLKALLTKNQVKAFNKYRDGNYHVVPKLAGLKVTGLDLSGANLYAIDLRRVVGLQHAKGFCEIADITYAIVTNVQRLEVLKTTGLDLRNTSAQILDLYRHVGRSGENGWLQRDLQRRPVRTPDDDFGRF